MSARETAWQRADVAGRYVEERRAAVPYRPDQVRIMHHLVEQFVPAPRRIVDLGAGDGVLARGLLERHPDAAALLLDHSEPMLARARAAMAPFADRCEIRLADLSEPLDGVVPPGSVDLVVSGYAIHHLPHARKRSLYAETLAALAPGGLFVNVDHVSSPTAELESLFDRLYVDHMAACLKRPREQAAAEHHGRPDKADNILAPVELQVEWLRELGFEHADCYFKWLELAVFGGMKPRAG